MSHNTKLMGIQRSPPRRPTMPVQAPPCPTRTLGTSRSGSMSKSGNFSPAKSDERKKDNDSKSTLSLKDITKFDLMSPFAVQQLTGNFQSSFPTITGRGASAVKMLNVQLPKNPYAALPRLALTKGDDARDEARTNLTRGLSRSHSELSHYRTRDSHHALQDRPHTESRLTRRAQHGGPTSFSSRASTISEESRQPQDLEDASISGLADGSKKPSRPEVFPRETDKTKPAKEFSHIQRAKLRSRSRLTRTESNPGWRTQAEKISNLGMSEYTSVHANNKVIHGQVWSGVKPRTAPDGSRFVRFDTHNDVFEYTPGQCLL